jgi:hypothetical protein
MESKFGFNISSIFLFFVFISICFSSCEEKGKPVYYLSQESKDYFLFRQGSHWIYFDSINNSFDSVYVKYDPHSQIFQRDSYSEEQISVNLQSDFILGYELAHQCLLEDDGSNNDRLSINFTEADSVEGQVLAMLPGQQKNIDQPDRCGFQQTSCYFKTEIIPVYIQENDTFRNVVHTLYRSQDTTMNNPYAIVYSYYFAKHIGLVHLDEMARLHHTNRKLSLRYWYIVQ